MSFPEISPAVSVVLFSIWLVLFLWGRSQLNNIKKVTTQLVIENIEAAKKKNKNLTLDQYYEILYPKFETYVRTNTKFVTHKTELFPMPAKPDYVKTRIHFTPEWVGAFLKLNGHTIIANSQQQETINHIVKLSNGKNR